MPTIFCNELIVGEGGFIASHKMRVEKSKYTTVKHLQAMGFDTIAAGDSYNDLGMIEQSKAGFLFRSTESIKAAYPQYQAFETYEDLLNAIQEAGGRYLFLTNNSSNRSVTGNPASANSWRNAAVPAA